MIPELLNFSLLWMLGMLALILLSEPETMEQRARREAKKARRQHGRLL